MDAILDSIYCNDVPEGCLESAFVNSYWQKIKGEPQKNSAGQLGLFKKGGRGELAKVPTAENCIFSLPNCTFDSLNKGSSPVPEHIGCLKSQIVVLAPTIFWNNHIKLPKCPRCQNNANVTLNGFGNQPRRLACLAKVSYIYQQRWKCAKCPSKSHNFACPGHMR